MESEICTGVCQVYMLLYQVLAIRATMLQAREQMNAMQSRLCFMQVTGAQHDCPGPPIAIRDESKVWETIAAAQYKLDGDDAGWESDVSDDETPDDKYIRVRADGAEQAHQSLSCTARLPACIILCAL